MIDIDKLCGCKKKTPDERDYLFESLPARPAAVPMRASIKKGFPAVYCQRYGDCTANAALACDDYYFHEGKPWIPSTVFTYYNAKADDQDLASDDGSSVESALKAVRKYGACSAKVWKNDMPWNEKPSKKAYENGKKGKEITSFYRIKNFAQIKEALTRGYPVAACIEWAFDYYDDDFVLNNPTKQAMKKYELRCHAIVIVGYDDEKKLVEIRNSWGEGWANKGYGFITYDTMKKVIQYDDTYAIVK